MPLTSWEFWLNNDGNVTARYPLVQITFRDAFFNEDAFPGWQALFHAHAFGWYGFQWSPGDSLVVHAKSGVKLPTMYFANKQIGNPLDIFTDLSLKVQVLIVSDGFKDYYELPVNLDFVDF